MASRRLFIAGATGAVGRALLSLAAERQIDIVPHVRPQSAAALEHPKRLIIDLTDPQLSDAIQGCTTVVQLIGTMRKRFSRGDTYESSDIGTTRLLVEASKKAEIDHFVLLSSVGAGNPFGAYLRAKAQAEQLVRESGVPCTIIRPSAFEDRPGQWMPGLRAVTQALGLVRYQPITLKELAKAILVVAATRGSIGQVLEGRSLWDCVKAGDGLSSP
jgi:uncharacterized protein YbjT (DUF2867 family)